MFLHPEVGIRAIEESDLKFLKDQRNHPSTWQNLTSISMLNDIKQKKWLESISQDPSRLFFLVFEVSTNIPIGLVRCDEVDHLNQSIRIGADIHMNHRGKGYGTKLYELLLDYCFNYLNMNRVWLLVLETNTRARHLYEKSGFTVEGIMRQSIYRQGSFRDCIVMSILRQEYYETSPCRNDVSM